MICARSGSARSAEVLVAVATLAALAGLAWVAVRTPVKAFGGVAQTRQFLRRIMLLLALLSAIGISWAGAAMIVLPACLSLR
jgi:hypothetical protein